MAMGNNRIGMANPVYPYRGPIENVDPLAAEWAAMEAEQLAAEAQRLNREAWERENP